jgi:proline iminopeptidase
MIKIIFLFLLISVLYVNAYAQKEGTVHCEGGRIYYRTYGEGKPLLIINGGPGLNSDGFVSLAKQLSKHNQTIIYDQRGTGKSAMEKTDSTTITMKAMAADIECLRKHLHIDEWIILGHSFGGMVASYYASLYPEKVAALILSSSGGIDLELLSYVGKNVNAKLTAKELDSVNYWTKKINEGDTSYHARLERGMSLAPAYVYNRKFIPVIAERLTQGNSAVNGFIWQDLQKTKFNCTDKLKSFNKPVLIIQGKQDIIAEKTALKAHKVLKNSRLVLMDRCVHYGWLDRPDEYFAEVEKFLIAN